MSRKDQHKAATDRYPPAPPSYHIQPSKRKRPQRLKIPAGCTDVWLVVQSYRSPAEAPIGIFLDEEEAYALADKIWLRHHSPDKQRRSNVRPVFVNHKAALNFCGKWHFVNIPSFRLTEPGSKPELLVS